MRNNIENPYKVNVNHHYDKGISADLVEEVFNGTVKWICYLFAASAVTPMRTTEFDTLNDAEQWAKDKGSEIWTYFPLDDERVKHCVRCDNGFLVLDTLPDQVYCSEACWQSVKQSEDRVKTNDGRQRHLLKRLQTELRNEGKANHREYIITISTNGYRIGRVIGDESVGHIVYHVHCNTVAECIEWIDTQKRKGQTIDFQSCLKKDSLDAITKDIYTLAEIECSHANALTHAEIIFVDGYGNRYEYDGVCISEGKLKVAIKSQNKPIKIKRMYFDFEGDKQILSLNLTNELVEKIRKERECMPPENRLSDDEIRQYLNEGFTIHTFQASYCKEGHEFSPLADSK